MRGANLSSPSVAYRNLQKLVDLGLVIKDNYSNYVVKEKVGMKGYVWVGKILMPSFAIFGFIFIGILITEIVILIPHLVVGAGIEESFWLLIVLTFVTASIFMFRHFVSEKNPTLIPDFSVAAVLTLLLVAHFKKTKNKQKLKRKIKRGKFILRPCRPAFRLGHLDRLLAL